MHLLNFHHDALLALTDAFSDLTLVNFALTCRQLWVFAEPLLHHRKYVWRYSTIRIAEHLSDHAHWRHPIEVIDELRRNPKAAEYARVLEYHPPICREWSHFDHDKDKRFQTLFESHGFLSEYIDDFPFLSHSESAMWKEAGKRCDPNPAFMVLLSLCKTATTLSLGDVYDLRLYLSSVIRYLVKCHEDSKTCGADSRDLTLFPKLFRLNLQSWDTELGLDFEEVYPLLRIPTLREFSGSVIGDSDDYAIWEWPGSHVGRCRVEKVSLEDCTFSPSALISFIRGLPGLVELTLTDRWDFNDVADNWRGWDGFEEYAACLREESRGLLEERGLRLSSEDTRAGTPPKIQISQHGMTEPEAM